MTITLCNSHPFTFYLPFHTSLRADQCPIQSHVPSTCTLGLDPCARHSLFGRTDPYYIDNFYSSCGLKRLAATLASPLLCNCTVLPVPLSTGPYLDQAIPASDWLCGGPYNINSSRTLLEEKIERHGCVELCIAISYHTQHLSFLWCLTTMLPLGYKFLMACI